MGSKPRIKGVCPDQTCILFDQKCQKPENDLSNHGTKSEIIREIANELGLGFRTVQTWLARRDKLDAIASIRENSAKSIKYPPLPDGKFNLIYADPPWQYDFSKSGRREIEKEYDTATNSQIAYTEDQSGKTIQSIIADNAILFLCVPSPKLEQGMELLKLLGFEYKTDCVYLQFLNLMIICQDCFL